MPDTHFPAELSAQDIKKTNKAIAGIVSALHSAQRNIATGGPRPSARQRASAALVANTFSNGFISVSYGYEQIEIDMEKLPDFLVNPVAVAAQYFEMDESSLVDWLLNHAHGRNDVAWPCSHSRCKMVKTTECESVSELIKARKYASEGVWYCHHHQQQAWDEKGLIAADLVPLLRYARINPGCNKTVLGGHTVNLKFLCSIGLLSDQAITRGRQVRHAYTLTEAGNAYLSRLDTPNR